jgi:thymidylate synthase
MVNAWNLSDLGKMILPPCHYGFQMYTRELSLKERISIAETNTEIIPVFDSHFDIDEDIHNVLDTWNTPTRAISLMWNQRSVDTFLGLPFNIASYGLLLEIIAKEVNMVPDELIGNLGDVHLYQNHLEQAKEQIGRTPYELPILKLGHLGSILENISVVDLSDFEIENYQFHPTIKAPLSN